MPEPLLTLGYSVLAARVGNIQLPAASPDLEIIVVVQGGEPVGGPTRSDVRYDVLDSIGVAKSRNRVLDQARGRYVLFADDDVVFVEAGVRRLVAEMERDPQLALVLAATVDEHGRLRKRYPRRSALLTRWNSAKAATYEMMARREAVQRSGVRFDERFGAGGALYLGDEYIFITDMIAAGLRCRFFPHVIAMHPEHSSGSRFRTAEDAEARAVVFSRVFGRRAPLARLAFVARSPRRFRDASTTFRFVLGR